MTANQKKWFVVSLLSALIATGLHFYLTYEFFLLKLGLASGKSLCNVNSVFNCDAVAISPYAQFLGYPIALWGVMTNGLFIVFLILSYFNYSDHKTEPNNFNPFKTLTLSLAFIILSAAIVMGLVSSFLLKTYCLFCLATYVCSLFIFIGSVKFCTSNPSTILHLPKQLFSNLLLFPKIFLFVLIVPAGVWLGQSMFLDSFGASQLGVISDEAVANWKLNPKIEFDLNLGIKTVSHSNPKLTIIEFVDMLCPHCKIATPQIKLYAEAREQVELIIKFFPLDQTCNPEMQRKGDGVRCQLASAALCAEKIAQKGSQATLWIFERQNDFSLSQISNQLESLAKELGLDYSTLKSCLSDQSTYDQLVAMSLEGKKANLEGTPTLYFNGKKFYGPHLVPAMDAVLKAID